MARPLVIGNGQLLICFDQNLAMRDLYYPHVGQLNHIVGKRNQIGLWVDGEFAWLGEDGWERRLRYKDGTLVTDSTAVHQRLGIEVTIESAVHQREAIFVQRVRLSNRLARGRDLRLFATFDFDIDETDVGDTAMWEPTLGAVLHYKRRRCFLIGAQGPLGGIDQYATGRKRFMGAEGTWRDAEDGHLEGHPISQGAVDSTIRLMVPLTAHGSAEAYIWVVCNTSFQGVRAGHRLVKETGPHEMLGEIGRYWQSWAESGGGVNVSNLPAHLQEAYRRSLLIVRTQVDNGGAIIAANDSDIRDHNRDHYSYMWPRDGALVAGALDRAGLSAVTRRFYRFCATALTEGGYLMHKYNPDGSMGSSWHPLVGPKGIQLPIQEDETALVLWALGSYYRIRRSQEFVDSLYATLIRPAADFLVSYRDERTALPQESYDLWEERRGVFTFTTASVVAGLREAALMAAVLGDQRRAEGYSAAAAQTQRAMERHLWSEEHGRFLRGVYVGDNGELVPDLTLESSVAGVFLLGVLSPRDPKVEKTMKALEAGLWAPGHVGGIARYAGDYYFRMVDDAPGNPWIICTLWLARWYIQRAQSREELQPGLDLIDWTLKRALPTGVLPEQVHPHTGAPLSVAPLTWSHSTLCDTLQDLAEKLQELGQ
ncbi:MAG: glycoside hydrolase family 15 protein [Bacillota bacterium]